MLDQVSGQHIEQGFRDQSQECAEEIGAGGDVADRKAEIDDVGGYDIDGAAEDHGPEPVSANPFVDPFDQFLFPEPPGEIVVKGIPDHVEGRHHRQQTDPHADNQGRCEIQQETEGHGDVEHWKPCQGAQQDQGAEQKHQRKGLPVSHHDPVKKECLGIGSCRKVDKDPGGDQDKCNDYDPELFH